MAQITINEVSQTYSYNIGTNSFATVALPITSSWGPGYFDPDSYSDSVMCEGTAEKIMIEKTAWQRFSADQQGLEAFVAAYRGPATNYRIIKDFSYQYALTLLTAGYDVLVCRVCPGECSTGRLAQDGGAVLNFKAKYPGSFGNNIQVVWRRSYYFDTESNARKPYFNVITYVLDASGARYSAESLSFVLSFDESTDNIPYYQEVESNFWTLVVEGTPNDSIPHEYDGTKNYIRLSGGSDWPKSYDNEEIDQTSAAGILNRIALQRYEWAKQYSNTHSEEYDNYPQFLSSLNNTYAEWATSKLQLFVGREWVLSSVVGTSIGSDGFEGVYDLLKDKLAYNPQRVISPGWDDQDYLLYLNDLDYVYTNGYYDICDVNNCNLPVSPLSLKLMDVGYHSRCATALIDIPRILDKKHVYINSTDLDIDGQGYAQKMARLVPSDAMYSADGGLFATHSALFAPWGQYTFVGMSRMQQASPTFLALMIQRAQILNQAAQYEWALPTNRKHNLRIGKMDYVVPKKLLDAWQSLEGASVNIITNIPDLGTNLWGNSTIYEVPPASYQALANLSTRYLVNAVENVAYRVGVSITFQYNNNQAYNKFYAGVTPILDTMKNVGAIEDYYVRMAADVNGLDQVNANTVVGKIYLVVNGVINDIIVDLVCLPPGSDLSQYNA